MIPSLVDRYLRILHRIQLDEDFESNLMLKAIENRMNAEELILLGQRLKEEGEAYLAEAAAKAKKSS